jgi:xanthine dehydrogenase YagR molybdenum-binding subunit
MNEIHFDAPAGANPIDREKVVGKPVDRVDGPRKVSGQATYAYEYHAEAPNAAYGVMLGAGISRGRIVSLDTRDAEAMPGVLLVMTHRNAPKQGPRKGDFAPQLTGPELLFHDQAVAFVVAETFEQARDAAKHIQIAYEAEPGKFDLAKEKANAVKPSGGWARPDTSAGDFDAGFAFAPVKLDVTYTTPDQSHAMMEPHATIARWDGDRLTVWTANQLVNTAVGDLAGTLLIPKEKIRVVSAFVGGGFGGKLWIQADCVLAALGARAIGRPVKVALARPQVMNNTTHRPATIQRIRIGTDRDGHILAIGHESWNGNQTELDGNIETAAMQTRTLYAGKDRMTMHRLAELHLPKGNAMRAPGEAVGLLALECAMDELAERLHIDPVEFRILNDVQYDPEAGPKRPFSSRKLVECLRTGAERFGWSKRMAQPGRQRDGRWLIGLGVAAGIRNNLGMDSRARVTLRTDGSVLVETDMTDIGTGSYTILAQTAAEMLGVDLAQVEVRLADSRFPTSCGSGGSWGANSSTAGLYAACEELRRLAAQRVGINAADVVFEGGEIRSGGQSIPLVRAASPSPLSAEGGIKFGGLQGKFAQASFAAHFCEVGVDRDTAEVRVRRMLTVAAAGRILNPKTARNQCLGGMTMGIGAALMEEAVVDKRFGYFVNRDLAEYHIPVHADIPELEVVFLEELDDKSSPMKAKGVGELGICGVGAAVANAVYNATGIRSRDYPLTLDKLLPRMA